MAGDNNLRQVLGLFADMLDYPGPGLGQAARDCEALVAPLDRGAGALLGEFRAFVEGRAPGELEEIYTRALELDATCYLYVGYHLFGESHRRSVFMVELKERYRARGFSPGNELPDHLTVLLRFLAMDDDGQLAREIIDEALLPVLGRMVSNRPPTEGGEEQAEPSDSRDSGLPVGPYTGLLRALWLVLQQWPLSTEAAQQRAYPEGGSTHV